MKHPIVIKTFPNNPLTGKVVGFLTHAPKAPKTEGSQSFIELSEKTNKTPMYIKPVSTNNPTIISFNLLQNSKEIAADGSTKEKVIDKKLHEKP